MVSKRRRNERTHAHSSKDEGLIQELGEVSQD